MNDAFLYLVEILQSLVDRFVPVSNQTRVPIWMRGPPSCLAKEKVQDGRGTKKSGESMRDIMIWQV